MRKVRTIREAKQSKRLLFDSNELLSGKSLTCRSQIESQPRYCPNSIVQSSSRSGEKNCSRAAAKSLVAVRRVIFHRWKEMALFECTCECEKLAIEIKERFLNGRRLIVFDFLSNGSWDDFQKIVKWGGKYQLAKGNLGRLGKTK